LGPVALSDNLPTQTVMEWENLQFDLRSTDGNITGMHINEEDLVTFISRAVGVKVEKVKHILNVEDYILTFDFMSKMININEQREAGIPTVIQEDFFF